MYTPLSATRHPPKGKHSAGGVIRVVVHDEAVERVRIRPELSEAGAGIKIPVECFVRLVPVDVDALPIMKNALPQFVNLGDIRFGHMGFDLFVSVVACDFLQLQQPLPNRRDLLLPVDLFLLEKDSFPECMPQAVLHLAGRL